MGKSENLMSQNRKYIPEKHKYVVCHFPFDSSWLSVIDTTGKKLYVERWWQTHIGAMILLSP